MAQINPHNAGSACGIESVVNGCVDPLVDCYPQLIAQSLDDLHPEICPRLPEKGRAVMENPRPYHPYKCTSGSETGLVI